MNNTYALKNYYKIHHKFPKIMESLSDIKIMLNNISTSFLKKIEEETVECAPLGCSQRLLHLPVNQLPTTGDYHRSGAPHGLSTSSRHPLEDGGAHNHSEHTAPNT